MNGAGNDFILLDAIAEPFDESAAPALARALCDRRRSVGADGLMLVTRAEGDADYRMRFYNSDGSLGEMCGNGARCICRYGYAHGYAGPVQRVETTAGLVTGWRITEEQYRIRLNTPSVVELEKQLDADGRTYRCSYVELGSPGIPHLALEVPALAKQSEDALRRLGRALRYHPALPKGANVNFYELTGPDEILEKTYERGVEDFTLACGTGTGSVAAALTLLGRVSGKNVRVRMDGGELTVDAEEKGGSIENLYLTGPAAMVCAGEIMQSAARESGAEIIPVDSEHSAIFQGLMGCRDRAEVKRLILTCSGGPFFGKTRESLACMTKSDALRHPNWKMGAKITVDCATLMNKGLEIIEAMRLYDLPLSKVTAVIHRQSVVHSLVEFVDGAVLAQLGVPDMRIPIGLAMTYPNRAHNPAPALDLLSCGPLTFDAIDETAFPCFTLAQQAAQTGGTACTAMNAANEEAVGLFLQDKIGFYDIADAVEAALRLPVVQEPSLADIFEADRLARIHTRERFLK